MTVKTKKCTGIHGCGLEKLLKEFGKDKNTNDGLKSCCRLCRKKESATYYDKNKETIKKQVKKYCIINKVKLGIQKKTAYLENSKEILKYQKEYYKKCPWKRTFQNIRNRCENTKIPNYKWYGGRGIKCLITVEELEILWFRDKAWLLYQPSIDREDNDGDYTFDNCRYIELGLNSAERNVRVSSKAIFQLDLEGKFIKEWFSISEASRQLKIAHTNINACCLGIRKATHGYKWKYKNDTKR